MAGLYEGGNEPTGSLKAKQFEYVPNWDSNVINFHLQTNLMRDKNSKPPVYFDRLRRLPANPELRSGESSIPAWADYLVGNISIESYPAFAHIGLRENPGKNLNQVTCPDRDSNLGHLVPRPGVLTVTPQVWTPESCYLTVTDLEGT
ncbi:hypothetical protein ANN_09245 [Periplaneta americana]|uniref:Uncharacterized protein n=1 Tax=Periplaneta americana TaxID=6978 RepID=A0ABQ8TMW0_PERAM|nr:hypothetical protein ANN_09245 [Periplaneta americana]